MSISGPYVAEKLTDLSYSICAYGIFIFYHYGFLEFFAVVCILIFFSHSLEDPRGVGDC